MLIDCKVAHLLSNLRIIYQTYPLFIKLTQSLSILPYIYQAYPIIYKTYPVFTKLTLDLSNLPYIYQAYPYYLPNLPYIYQIYSTLTALPQGSLAQPQMLSVGDVADVFVPLLDGFLSPAEQSGPVLQQLLQQLPAMFQDNKETETILLPAVQVCF